MTDAFTYVVVRMQNLVAGLRDREEGQAMVEYALILALVTAVAVVGLALLPNFPVRVFSATVNAFP